MKKSFLLFLLITFLSLFINCAGIKGPIRNITITNNTDIDQVLTFTINDTTTEEYTIPANDKISFTIVGGYTIKDDIDFRYSLTYINENTLEINNATKGTYTIINQLEHDIVLLDNMVEEFSCNISSGETKEIQNWNIVSDYRLQSRTA